MTGVHGLVTVVGVARPEETVTLPAAALVTSEKLVQGSRIGSGDFRVDIPLYCQMYLRGQLKLDELISEVIGLGEATRGLEQLDRSDGARSVISFAGGRG
jgi:S-(hydroxymethyl)glutathione dehydrogenase/alcohol dehydrogenase